MRDRVQKLLEWITSWFARVVALLRPSSLRLDLTSDLAFGRRYVNAACEFARRVDVDAPFTPVEIEAALLEWENAELDYSGRGFQTLPLHSFVDYVTWNVPLHPVGIRREVLEQPMLHARYYRYFVLKRRNTHELTALVRDEARSFHS